MNHLRAKNGLKEILFKLSMYSKLDFERKRSQEKSSQFSAGEIDFMGEFKVSLFANNVSPKFMIFTNFKQSMFERLNYATASCMCGIVVSHVTDRTICNECLIALYDAALPSVYPSTNIYLGFFLKF